MAPVALTADMTIQKNSKILVTVEEALTDLIVVSYHAEDKKFQGVLLDSNKGNLPFGVYSLHPAFSKNEISSLEDKEKLHSVSQRFTYQESKDDEDYVQKSKKSNVKGKPQPRQKMTVRLRPRKVLCSNCQGICNENSENVDVSKKRKLDDETPQDGCITSKVEKTYLSGGMLIPKLSRLQPSEISNALKASKTISKSSEKTLSFTSNKSAKSDNESITTRELAFVSVSDNSDLCDTEDNKDGSFSNLFSSARTLKICFGEGEGTVVKIPPLSGDFNEDSGVSCDMAKPLKLDSKAGKKALKKAKKQAKKVNSVDNSEELWLEQSPKHIGALSPRNNMSDSPPRIITGKKHKHRVKHKKKYKVQKKHDENGETVDYFSNIKDDCVKQKLSISLRRLSSNSYEKSEDIDGSDDGESEAVPDFPLSGLEGAGGKLLRVSPGDIVWGKVIGFPWWPGRVLSVTSTSRAQVAWFASTTTSLMPCDSLSPFLDDYKLRFNKKKRGPYKEAVKQATVEARKVESHLDPLASPTHSLTQLSPRPIDVFS